MLNFYETASLVGYLLDLIYQSRKVEEIKIRLMYSANSFNLVDAWLFLQPNSFTKNNGRLSMLDMREALLKNKAKSDKITMDRIQLLFSRYNL